MSSTSEMILDDVARHEHQLRTLRLLVEFADETLQDLQTASATDRDCAVAQAFRQCAEFADAVHLVSVHGMGGPAAALARTCIETAAHCAFLATDDSALRVAAYEIATYLAQIQGLENRSTEPTADEEDRRDLNALSSEWLEALEKIDHPAWRAALEELRKQKKRMVWYEVDGGPKSIHQMLERTGLSQLSIFYREMNATVHGGNKHALAAIEQAGTWLPRLRSPSPFGSQNLSVAALALQIATFNVAGYFARSSPHLANRYIRFAAAHDERMRQAGWMPA